MTEKLSTDELKRRLKGTRLLSLDVDGVLTDGGLYYADDGSQMRRFNVKDGMGMQLARKAGVEVCLITASQTPAIHHRGEALGLKYVAVGVEDKLASLRGFCDELGVSMDAVAHIGDDVNDLPVLGAVGLPMTVADAVAPVVEVAAYVTGRPGGAGAVREICDLIVEATGYVLPTSNIPPAR